MVDRVVDRSIHEIENDEQYQSALWNADTLAVMCLNRETTEADDEYLGRLSLLIEAYETKHRPELSIGNSLNG